MLNDNTEWVEGGFASVNRLHIYFILLCMQHIVHSETLGSEGDPWPQGARSKSRECFLILSPPQSPARQRVWDCSAPVSPEVCKRGDAPLFRGFISFGWACVRRHTDIQMTPLSALSLSLSACVILCLEWKSSVCIIQCDACSCTLSLKCEWLNFRQLGCLLYHTAKPALSCNAVLWIRTLEALWSQNKINIYMLSPQRRDDRWSRLIWICRTWWQGKERLISQVELRSFVMEVAESHIQPSRETLFISLSRNVKFRSWEQQQGRHISE